VWHGVIDVQPLPGLGPAAVGQPPDPRGAIAEDERAGGLAQAAAQGFGQAARAASAASGSEAKVEMTGSGQVVVMVPAYTTLQTIEMRPTGAVAAFALASRPRSLIISNGVIDTLAS